MTGGTGDRSLETNCSANCFDSPAVIGDLATEQSLTDSDIEMIVRTGIATYGSFASMKLSSSKNRFEALNSGGRGDFVKVLGE